MTEAKLREAILHAIRRRERWYQHAQRLKKHLLVLELQRKQQGKEGADGAA